MADGARSQKVQHEEPAIRMTWSRRFRAVNAARPAEWRGGSLRAVREHPFARSSAVLTLFVYILVGLSPIWVPAAQRGGIEVCTAIGLQVVPADLPSSGVPADKAKPKGDCPLCRIHTSFLLLPPDGMPAAAGERTAVLVHFGSANTLGGPFAGFDHLSRAPPALS